MVACGRAFSLQASDSLRAFDETSSLDNDIPVTVGRQADAGAQSRARKRRWVTRFHRFIANPLMRPLAGRLPGLMLLETEGRVSGRRRRTPVGGRIDGSTFWMVSDHGRASGYVKNIEANPRVRLRVRGRWYTGVAKPVPDDDPAQRLKALPRFNGWLVRALGTNLMTVRIDLDS